MKLISSSKLKIIEAVVSAPSGKPKLSKQESAYVSPENGQGIRCGNCNMFLKEGTGVNGKCTIVKTGTGINEKIGVCYFWAERDTKPRSIDEWQEQNKYSWEASGYAEIEPNGSSCGKCNHFKLPNSCKMIEGEILQEDCCMMFNNEKNFLETDFTDYGIPQPELDRAINAQIELPTPDAKAWPPDLTGELDIADRLNNFIVPATKYPPILPEKKLTTDGPYGISNVNPYPEEFSSEFSPSTNYGSMSPAFKIKIPPATGDMSNWLGTASDVGSEPNIVIDPSMNWASNRAIPEWRRKDVEQSAMVDLRQPNAIMPSGQFNELEPILATYHYNRPHEADDICLSFSQKVYDLTESRHRPVPPSEGLGYTNTHPNCQCYWIPIKATQKKVGKIGKKSLEHIQHVQRSIGQKSRYGSLHSVKDDGSLSQRTRASNPLREAIEELKKEFRWFSPQYLKNASELAQGVGGKMLLIRASQATITDHRSEGEQYRRKLASDEMMAMARTAIGRDMDINHKPEFRTNSTKIIDSEYDPDREEIQMLVHESDPVILQAIENDIISAVSINGGPPRAEELGPCDEHCLSDCEICMIPRGVVLGEADNIGLTYVVSNPKGFFYKGQVIPPASPGVKTTAIEIL